MGTIVINRLSDKDNIDTLLLELNSQEVIKESK